jgi:hypothetical protein
MCWERDELAMDIGGIKKSLKGSGLIIRGGFYPEAEDLIPDTEAGPTPLLLSAMRALPCVRPFATRRNTCAQSRATSIALLSDAVSDAPAR